MPYLIDGHNLIGRVPGLRLDDPEDERKLIVLLRAYLARAGKTATVIFDRGRPGGPGQRPDRILEVRFAPAPQTADELIVKRLRAAKNPRGLTVVTSDAAVAQAARRAGARVKDAAAFARALLVTPLGPPPKETGLSAAEAAEWEKLFNRPKN